VKKLFLIVILGGAYYFYSTQAQSDEDKIFNVADNPIQTSQYIELWDKKAIKMCEVNAKDYGINIKNCPSYISQKILKCKSKIPSDLPFEVSSKAEGSRIINKYFKCIAPYPHCSGKEVKNDFDARKYCKNV